MIDIHSHLLPEVDDGPKNWEIAVEMCRMAAADGITHMVATPHANDRFVDSGPPSAHDLHRAGIEVA